VDHELHATATLHDTQLVSITKSNQLSAVCCVCVWGGGGGGMVFFCEKLSKYFILRSTQFGGWGNGGSVEICDVQAGGTYSYQ